MAIDFIKQFKASKEADASMEDFHEDVAQEGFSLEDDLAALEGYSEDGAGIEEYAEEGLEEDQNPYSVDDILGTEDMDEDFSEEDDVEVPLYQMLDEDEYAEEDDSDPSEVLDTQDGFNDPYKVNIPRNQGDSETFTQDPDAIDKNTHPEDDDDAARKATETLDTVESYAEVLGAMENFGATPGLMSYMGRIGMLDRSAFAGQTDFQDWSQEDIADNSDPVEFLVANEGLGVAIEGLSSSATKLPGMLRKAAGKLGEAASKLGAGAKKASPKAAAAAARNPAAAAALISAAAVAVVGGLNVLKDTARGNVSGAAGRLKKSSGTLFRRLGKFCVGSVKQAGKNIKSNFRSMKADIVEGRRDLAKAPGRLRKAIKFDVKRSWIGAKIKWTDIKAAGSTSALERAKLKAKGMLLRTQRVIGDAANRTGALARDLNKTTERVLHLRGKSALVKTSAKLGAGAVALAAIGFISWCITHVISAGADFIKRHTTG